jgi:hypothetical protein
MVQHAAITDPRIHEPKGVAAASANTVYRANGSGSGSWVALTSTSLNWADIVSEINADILSGDIEVIADEYLTCTIEDVSTASSVLLAIPDDCTVVSALAVLGGAITVGDAEVNFKNSSGAAMGTPMTVAFTSSNKGTMFTFTASGNNTLVGPTWMEVTTDGGSTTAQPLYITIKLRKQLN